jgi:hypothetical protein
MCFSGRLDVFDCSYQVIFSVVFFDLYRMCTLFFIVPFLIVGSSHLVFNNLTSLVGFRQHCGVNLYTI